LKLPGTSGAVWAKQSANTDVGLIFLQTGDANAAAFVHDSVNTEWRGTIVIILIFAVP
jgi:hypothetical protein